MRKTKKSSKEKTRHKFKDKHSKTMLELIVQIFLNPGYWPRYTMHFVCWGNQKV